MAKDTAKNASANRFKTKLNQTNPDAAKNIVTTPTAIINESINENRDNVLDSQDNNNSIVEDTVNSIEQPKDDKPIENTTDSKENTKKPAPKKEPKIEKNVFGIYLTNKIESDLKDYKKGGYSTNALLNMFVESVFDNNTGTFKVEIEDNVNKKTGASTVSLRKDIIKAIKTGAKKKGYSEADFFNKLIEEGMKNFSK